MMLSGAALEALIKAVLVAERPEIVQPDPFNPLKMFDWKGSGHELRDLLAELAFPLDEEERDVTRRLEVFVRWGGRYPASMRAMEMKHGPGVPAPASFSTNDFPVLARLWERLRNRLEESAMSRSRLNAENDQAMRRNKRAELIPRLERLSKLQEGGIALFEDPKEPNEPGAAISCGGCGAQFSLNRRRVAAICECRTLFHCEFVYDGSLGRVMPNVQTYPHDAPNKPVEQTPGASLAGAAQRPIRLTD